MIDNIVLFIKSKGSNKHGNTIIWFLKRLFENSDQINKLYSTGNQKFIEWDKTGSILIIYDYNCFFNIWKIWGNKKHNPNKSPLTLKKSNLQKILNNWGINIKFMDKGFCKENGIACINTRCLIHPFFRNKEIPLKELKDYKKAIMSNNFLIQSNETINVDINVTNQPEETPLHEACFHGHLENVKSLISNGSNVNLKNQYGETPLHEACLLGHLDIVKYLISNGANVTIRNQSGETPLDLARRKSYDEIILLLREWICRNCH